MSDITMSDRERVPVLHNFDFRVCTMAAAAAIGMGAANGGISTISVLIDPLEAEFGWARAEISFSYVLLTVGIALGGLGAGRVADRLPSGPVSAIGAIMMGAGLVLLSMQSSLGGMRAVFLVIGTIGFTFLHAPLLTAMALRFRKGQGRIIGLVMAGGAMGQALVPPLFQELVMEFGWRGACLLLGLGYMGLVAPLMLLVTKPAEQRTATADMEARWKIPPLLSLGLLSAAGLSCCMLMGVPSVHLIPHVTQLGHAPHEAANLVMIAMLAATVGRIAAGWIVDRLGALGTYALFSLLQTLAVYSFSTTEEMQAMQIAAIVYGIGFGGVMTALICALREAVPARHMGTAMAVVSLFAWAGMGLGGYQGGICFDATGSYDSSFTMAGAAGLANLAFLGLLGLLVARGRRKNGLQAA